MRQLLKLRPINRSAAIVVGLIAIPLLVSGLWRQMAFTQRQKTLIRFNDKIRAGLGTEVRFASSTDSPEQVRASIDSVASIIETRSGLKLSKETTARLASMEQEAVSGTRNRIKLGHLANALTDIGMERLANLSDSEIDQASTDFRALDGHIKLRASGEFPMGADEFKSNLQTARSESARGSMQVRSLLHTAVQQELEKKAELFSQAVPQQFGQAMKVGLTPSQAVLLTYAALADDSLADSRQTLKRMVETPRKSSLRSTPDAGPSTAFGPRGYLYSSPVNLVLNQHTLDTLLDRISGRGANQ